MNPRSSKILALALGLFWASLWALHPNVETDLIDFADTESYGEFLSHVGYRWMFVALVKCFVSLGLTLHESAVAINALLLPYLFYLVDAYLRLEDSPLRPESIVLLALASPILLLQKNVLSSDLVSGLLFFHAFVLIERLCRDPRGPSWRAAWAPGALLVAAQNVKSTAVVSSALYAALLFVTREAAAARIVGYTALWAAGFYLIDLACTWAIFGDPLHRFRREIGKPMGGNAPYEVAGAKASVPVPLALFHVFGHLKTFGRYGLPGLVVLFSLPRLWSRTSAKLYAAALVLYSLFGLKNLFAMERYWLAYLPFTIVLWALAWRSFRPALRTASLVLGLAIALGNYFLRFYPSLYQAVGDHVR